jgi:hypothetical protein
MRGWWRVVALCVAGVFPAGGAWAGSGENILPEYEVKALFLYNFAKYVAWPEDAFADAAAPLCIGVLGENQFGGALTTAVAGKSIDGRPIVVRQVGSDDDWGQCHILFISASENRRLIDILDQLGTRPILTVGESDRFMEHGGIINFASKGKHVRLQISSATASKARLKLSARLLSVADVVKGGGP